MNNDLIYSFNNTRKQGIKKGSDLRPFLALFICIKLFMAMCYSKLMLAEEEVKKKAVC